MKRPAIYDNEPCEGYDHVNSFVRGGGGGGGELRIYVCVSVCVCFMYNITIPFKSIEEIYYLSNGQNQQSARVREIEEGE